LNLNPKFITDHKGEKISVVLPIKDYNLLMEELEEIEDLKLYDNVKKSNEPSMPIDDAFKIIESKRKVK
jgi:hypothetical protein